MLHKCNIHCHSMDEKEVETFNIKDPGKWLPFVLSVDRVCHCKMSTDDEDDLAFGCTTVYTKESEIFIIDTPFSVFSNLFFEYKNQESSKIANL